MKQIKNGEKGELSFIGFYLQLDTESIGLAPNYSDMYFSE